MSLFQKIQVPTKRSKTNIKEKDFLVDTGEDDEGSSSFQKNVLDKLKRGEIDGQHSRQMFEQILSLHERHEATQKVILDNQKKIKKALLKNKVRLDEVETS